MSRQKVTKHEGRFPDLIFQLKFQAGMEKNVATKRSFTRVSRVDDS